MRKLSIVMVIAVVLTMLSSFCYAADSAIFLGSETGKASILYDGTGDFNLSIYSNSTHTVPQAGYFVIKFDDTKWTYNADKTTSSYESISATQGKKKNSNKIEVSLNNSAAENVATGQLLCTLSFSPIGDINSVAKTSFSLIDEEEWGSSFAGETVAAIATAAEANREVAGYTDVVNFSSSLTNVTATAPTLTFDLYEDGVKHNVTPYEVNLGNGVTLDGSTLNFKIAVYGAPTNKTITLVDPAVK